MEKKSNFGKLCDGLQNVKGTDLKAKEITEYDSSVSIDNENVQSKTETVSPIEKVAGK